MRCLFATIVLLQGPALLAQSGNPVASAGTSAEWNSNTNSGENANDTQSQVFQLSINYGTGSLTLEVNGDRSLNKVASPTAYEDGQPVSGTYSNGSVKQLRTVASTLLPFRGSILHPRHRLGGLGYRCLWQSTQ